MPGNLKMPTGFEDLQQKAATRRKLADALTQLGLQNNQGYHSWAQVLGQLADAWAGHSLNKEADTLNDQYNTKLMGAFTGAHGQFEADAKAGMSPEDLQAKYGNNQFVTDDLKPYAEAIAARQKAKAENSEKYVNTTDRGYQLLTSEVGRVPYDPNKTVNIVNGQAQTNPVKITADRLAQATGPAFNAVTSMPMPGQAPPMPAASPGVPPAPPPHDPYYSPAPATGMPFTPSNIQSLETGNRGDLNPNGSPVTSSAGAKYGMQVLDSTAHNPGFGVRPASSDSPTEYDRVGRDYAAAMLRRYGDPVKAAAAYNGGPGRTDRAIATSGNSFLNHLPAETQNYAGHFGGSARQPDGMTTDGRPYWMVNGTPYDNPEGR